MKTTNFTNIFRVFKIALNSISEPGVDFVPAVEKCYLHFVVRSLDQRAGEKLLRVLIVLLPFLLIISCRSEKVAKRSPETKSEGAAIGDPAGEPLGNRWCLPSFLPGSTLAEGVRQDVRKADFTDDFNLKRYKTYSHQVGREAVGMLWRVFGNFSSKENHIWYGSFNEPGEPALDNAHGLRLIVSRVFKSQSDVRLMVLISFWDFDRGAFKLRTGPDAMRMRYEITTSEPDNPNGQFASISLDVSKDEDGKIIRIVPTSVYDDDGGRRPVVNSSAAPSEKAAGCFSCHGREAQVRSKLQYPLIAAIEQAMADGDITDNDIDFRDAPVDAEKTKRLDEGTLKKVLDTVGPGDYMQGLRRRLASPEKYRVPEGINETLQKHCDEFSKEVE